MTSFCVFLDLKKAFDKHKTRVAWNSRSCLKMVRIIPRRTEAVCSDQRNETMSQPKILRTGVPQSPILGPVLFLIYMNDMKDICTFFTRQFLQMIKMFQHQRLIMMQIKLTLNLSLSKIGSK